MSPTTTPIDILRAAIKAVPAVKWALGIAGIVAAIAIIEGFKIDLRVAVFGTVIMLILMTLLVIFAKAAGSGVVGFAGPAFVLTWFSLFLMMATATALFTSVFFKWPVNLQWVLQRHDAGATDAKPPLQGPDKSDAPRVRAEPSPNNPTVQRAPVEEENGNQAHGMAEFVGVWDSDQLADPLYTVPGQACVQDLTKKFELEVFEAAPKKFIARFRHMAIGSTHIAKPGEVLTTEPCSSSIPPFRGGHEFPTSIINASNHILSLQIDAWQQQIVLRFRRIGYRLAADPNQFGTLLNDDNRTSLNGKALVLFRR
jgi:hypothetical protein